MACVGIHEHVIKELIVIQGTENSQEIFQHYTVMLKETVDGLNCRPGLVYIDATLGGGGHSKEIVQRILPDGRLIGFEVDPVAIEAAKKTLQMWQENVTIVNASYTKIPEMLQSLNIEKITGGIVFDLGASYFQLTSAQKGFSFLKNSELDMRFDPTNELTAYDVVNSYSEEELARIFSEYGEERFSKRIAKRIIYYRKTKSIDTTVELADIVKASVPAVKSRIHPATRVFQAIRIEVNNELENIKNTLKDVITIMEKDARISIISFHSLEDRIVKRLFKEYSSSCKCPPHQMICNCEPPQLEVITRRPITASEEEVRNNPPSRSAKLRIARKV